MGKRVPGGVSRLRSKIMSSIKPKGTEPERLLRQAFAARGLRGLWNSTSLPGRPDFVFPQAGIVVFCDGDFWHGRRWKQRKKKEFRVRHDYWVAKIEGNIARDRRTNRRLRRLGWKVLRFWASEIQKNPEAIADWVWAECQLRQGSGRSRRLPQLH